MPSSRSRLRRCARRVAPTVAAIVLASGGVAVAKAPKAPRTPVPTKIGTSALSRDVFPFVDSHGTVHVAWEDSAPGTPNRLHYARKPAGAKTFREVSLPGTPQGTEEPFIYQTPSGELRLLADVTQRMYAWRSGDDGASWTSIDVSGLNALRADGVYVYTAALVAAPGGPIQYAGTGGANGPVVQLNGDLSGVTTLTSLTQNEGVATVGRSPGGTVFVLGYPTAAGLPFEVGAAVGAITFPTCPRATELGNPSMAVGRSVAVVADAGCGHVWTRTLAADGSVGPLVTLGATAQTSLRGLGANGAVDVVAGPDGGFTAGYLDPSGDLRVATSADGSRWTTGPGAVPVASQTATYGDYGLLSRGASSWYAGAVGVGPGTRLQVRAIALSDRYRTPAAPSGRGIPSPRHASLGSLAATVPGRLSAKGLRKDGIVKLSVVAAIPDTVTVSVTLNRKSASQDLMVCSASTRAKLVPGRARLLTLACGSGGFVIGGTASRGVDAKRGDTVAFSFQTRNGPLTATSRVG